MSRMRMKKNKIKKGKKYTNPNIEVSQDFLFRRGNVGLARLLIAVNAAGPQGISTVKLLQQLNSSNHAQAFLRRAAKEGLIERIEGESKHGHFKPVYNRITEKGRQLLTMSILRSNYSAAQ
jgi:hypothetical protein